MTIIAPTPIADETRRADTAPLKGRGARGRWPLTILLIIGSITIFVPLYVTITMALKTSAQAVDGNAFSLPAPFTLSSFAEAWALTDFPRALAISVFVTAIAVTGAILLSSAAAYAIVRNWDRRLFRWSFFYLLAAMFIPFPVVALPQIRLTGIFGLDNPVGVAILHIVFGLAFNTLLFTAFLRSARPSSSRSRCGSTAPAPGRSSGAWCSRRCPPWRPPSASSRSWDPGTTS